jgi:hypothetical protein
MVVFVVQGCILSLGIVEQTGGSELSTGKYEIMFTFGLFTVTFLLKI